MAVTRSGALYVKILRRKANLSENLTASAAGAANARQLAKLAIPKVSKLFMEGCERERSGDNASKEHRQLQRDLAVFRLNTARALAKALAAPDANASAAAILSSSDRDKGKDPVEKLPLRLSCRVAGLGPMFKLSILLENTSLSTALMSLAVVVTPSMGDGLYSIKTPMLNAPFICPGVSFSFSSILF